LAWQSNSQLQLVIEQKSPAGLRGFSFYFFPSDGGLAMAPGPTPVPVPVVPLLMPLCPPLIEFPVAPLFTLPFFMEPLPTTPPCPFVAGPDVSGIAAAPAPLAPPACASAKVLDIASAPESAIAESFIVISSVGVEEC
jgi:hypothetical protein